MGPTSRHLTYSKGDTVKPWEHDDLFNSVGTIEKNKAECVLISHHSQK